jgi:hypothetical protein
MTEGYPPLECLCIIYRALLRRDHIDPDSGHALAAAFMRRREVDVDGLSVALVPARSHGERELSVWMGAASPGFATLSRDFVGKRAIGLPAP